MKTFLRTILYLALALWLGAEFFFPFVAATVFTTLRPDTHTAGLIVGPLLGILHAIGLVAAFLAIAALAAAAAKGIYRPIPVCLPMGLLLLMAALTLHSQFVVTPAMERDRVAAGASIDAALENNPARIDFKRLHNHSEHIEGVIFLLGLLAILCVAREETVQSAFLSPAEASALRRG
jgi:hypothetical protein